MKVRIGKYTSRLVCNIYSSYMERKYGAINWPVEGTTFERYLEKVEDCIQNVYDVINYSWLDKRNRTIKVHIDDYDTWSMDSTLAYIILPMLKRLKETKQGAPGTDDEDVPEELRSVPTLHEEDENWFARWDWILDEMIWAFEQKNTDWESQYYGTWVDQKEHPFGGYFKSPDIEGLTAHHDRMGNGFRLFGKYYEALWT